MSRRPFKELLDPIKTDPERPARVEAGVQAMRDAIMLARRREQQGLTQADVAKSLAVSQPRVSQIEHQEDVYLSTLREYVAAIGGELEVRGNFPDGPVTLVGAKD